MFRFVSFLFSDNHYVIISDRSVSFYRCCVVIYIYIMSQNEYFSLLINKLCTFIITPKCNPYIWLCDFFLSPCYFFEFPSNCVHAWLPLMTRFKWMNNVCVCCVSWKPATYHTGTTRTAFTLICKCTNFKKHIVKHADNNFILSSFLSVSLHCYCVIFMIVTHDLIIEKLKREYIKAAKVLVLMLEFRKVQLLWLRLKW